MTRPATFFCRRSKDPEGKVRSYGSARAGDPNGFPSRPTSKYLDYSAPLYRLTLCGRGEGVGEEPIGLAARRVGRRRNPETLTQAGQQTARDASSLAASPGPARNPARRLLTDAALRRRRAPFAARGERYGWGLPHVRPLPLTVQPDSIRSAATLGGAGDLPRPRSFFHAVAPPQLDPCPAVQA